MSRYSYSLDVGEELTREKEVRRKIAAREDDDVRLNPKFEHEIEELTSDENMVTVNDEPEDIIITPKAQPKMQKMPERRIIKPKAEKPKAEKPEPKAVKKSEPKAVKKEHKTESKVEKPKVEDHKKPEVPSGPSVPGDDDGIGRLVVVLLVVAAIALILIYTGLASRDSGEAYADWAKENGLKVVTLEETSGAQNYWVKRALLADNEAESAAILRMALCDHGELTEESNPLDYSGCMVNGTVLAVREEDLRSLENLSVAFECDELDNLISCDGGYLVDEFVVIKGASKPQYSVFRSNGRYTVIKTTGDPETFVVVSDEYDNYRGYTASVEASNTMALRLWVGDTFGAFERAHLEHKGERTVLYSLV